MLEKLIENPRLLDKQTLSEAFILLFGKEYKKYWFDEDRAREMIAILKGNVQPCCPFENWVKTIEFLNNKVKQYDSI